MDGTYSYAAHRQGMCSYHGGVRVFYIPAEHHHEAPVAPGGGATAKCEDGSLSYSQHHQGTCSHHGGVAVWYK